MSRRFISQLTSQLTTRALWLGSAISLAAGVPVLALSLSVGSEGIDARRLHEPPYSLTGRKIAIGQVEIGRPGQFGLDKVAYEMMPVAVRAVFFRDRLASPNEYVDGHAANVASVMISQDKNVTGVAPGATLYSGAVGPLRGRDGQPEECLASQHIALQNGGDVRAMNFSFGESLGRDPRPNPMLDGNALLTQCIDWSHRVHDMLYVIAGNQGSGGIPIPTDNFNGINVAFSTAIEGSFYRIDYANMGSEPVYRPQRSPVPETNVGARRSINLVAPGGNLDLLDPDGSTRRTSGTSFAAPHVVATVALLQEFGDRQIRTGPDNWNLDARRPAVMKAVLLNSADKIKDQGDGLLLGMTRTLIDENNKTWLDSDAYSDPAIPLHADLGTGHLNAFRGYQQFQPGPQSPEAAVPLIGWNYGALESAVPPTNLPRSQPKALYQDYVFESSLQGGSFISATLAWDRLVVLEDENQNDLYDVGETFGDRGLNNLDLYLMPADADDISQSIWSSVSAADSVEHIFFPIPATGRYKLRVVYRQQVNDELQQRYALAWWAVGANL
ncbi:MAG: S8 family serine peptidase [Leptolyngbyaceae cyanobacterium SM1_1_3]|nr:S8 family serine peptidase [Leptolyngbyaceae cyanobacterium SM1_1_3]NJN03652.1 S8 family serine peptidase [Leptolyngbyaceae cyanobacterium RM1_1_2]NJO09114.1 S8 family serine peptidase [Leptolyngbyaceae cyanobacterium SL_1_1]